MMIAPLRTANRAPSSLGTFSVRVERESYRAAVTGSRHSGSLNGTWQLMGNYDGPLSRGSAGLKFEASGRNACHNERLSCEFSNSRHDASKQAVSPRE